MHSHNREKTAEEIELAPGITVANYLEFKENGKKDRIAELIQRRFEHRFIEPLIDSRRDDEQTRSVKCKSATGFIMIATGALLIEALHSLYTGKSAKGEAGGAFQSFFDKHERFKDFRTRAKDADGKEKNEFYLRFRCSLHHNGGTSGRWRILKSGKLIDRKQETVNACLFLKVIRDQIDEFCRELTGDTQFTDDAKCRWGKVLKRLDEIAIECGLDPKKLMQPSSLASMESRRTKSD